MHLRQTFLLITLIFQSSLAFALKDVTFCVWDPVGRNGPVMTFYSDVIPKAQAWGLRIRFEAYTEETDAVRDFKAGKCEAAVLTSILSRQFVKFAGTMDAIGAINSQEGLELAIATLTRKKAGNLMREGEYEVVTTFPVGSMYAFVKDRSVDTIEDFSGKSIAILNEDPQMRKFADLAGATPVEVRLSDFADKFNKGNLEILVMPALAYNTFELYEGLGDKGGIIDYRLYYGMLQTIAKHELFPEDFGSKMRKYMLTRLDAMNKMVKDAEEEIPSQYWIPTTQFVKDDIDHFSKRIRLALQDDNLNNPTALKLFWKIRCRLDASRGECKNPPDKKLKLAQEKAEQKKAQQRLAQEKKRQEQERLEKQKQQLELERIAAEKKRLEQERLALEEKNRQQKLALEQKRKLLAEAQEKAATVKADSAPLAFSADGPIVPGGAVPSVNALEAPAAGIDAISQAELSALREELEQERLALAEERKALEDEKNALEEEKRSLRDVLFWWI